VNNLEQTIRSVPGSSSRSFDELNDRVGDRAITAKPLLFHPTLFALFVHSAIPRQGSGGLKLSLHRREGLVKLLRRDTMLFQLSALADGARQSLRCSVQNRLRHSSCS